MSVELKIISVEMMGKLPDYLTLGENVQNKKKSSLDWALRYPTRRALADWQDLVYENTKEFSHTQKKLK